MKFIGLINPILLNTILEEVLSKFGLTSQDKIIDSFSCALYSKKGLGLTHGNKRQCIFNPFRKNPVWLIPCILTEKETVQYQGYFFQHTIPGCLNQRKDRVFYLKINLKNQTGPNG